MTESRQDYTSPPPLEVRVEILERIVQQVLLGLAEETTPPLDREPEDDTGRIPHGQTL